MNKRPSIPLRSWQPHLPHLFTFLFSLFTALALCASARAETVSIASAADWETFANRVNGGETSLDAKMTADVTLSQDSPFVGDSTSASYWGTFDGDGHKLTVNWKFTDGTQHVAPFRYTRGATIQNLHVSGKLESNGKFIAGFVGEVCNTGSGNNTPTVISNCLSSVAISTSLSGDSTSGGFVGHIENYSNAILECHDCLFTGFLLGSSATSSGGFQGYRAAKSSAYYYNCLFDPAEVTFSSDNSYTISRNGGQTFDKCYYTQSFGETQGTDASGMTADELAAALGDAWAVAQGRATLALFDPPSPPHLAVDGFTYQGALNELSGDPLSGEKTIEFRLYEQASGGEPVWGRSRKVFLDENGQFNVELSDNVGEEIHEVRSTGLADILASDSATTLYIGLTVSGTDGEVAPRQRLLSVPYADFASDSANASAGFEVAGRLSSGGLTVAGNAQFGSNATFKGATSVDGNLLVAGKITGPGGRDAYGTLPTGSIVIWSGAANKVPDGWALCDGTTNNGVVTPNLAGRFVVGWSDTDSDYSTVGNTGGEKKHQLKVDELPSHSHSYSFKGADLTLSWKDNNNFYNQSEHYGNNNTKYTDNAGGDQPHENRPPYYALCYIIRVK